MTRPLAIVCGSGTLPLEAAREASLHGRDPFLVGLVGSAGKEIEAFPHLWVRLGEVGKLLAAVRARGVEEMAFLGAVTRPELGDLLPDWGAVVRAGEIAKLFRGGDDALLRGVAQLFEGEGFRIVGPRDFAPGLLAPKGEIVGPRARRGGARRHRFRRPAAWRHVAVRHRAGLRDRRWPRARRRGGGGDGRHARARRRVARERPGAAQGPGGGVFVKAAKRGQDVRLDLPAVGPATIAAAKRAQLSGLAIAAGEVLIADKAVFTKAAEKAGLFVYGWSA